MIPKPYGTVSTSQINWEPLMWYGEFPRDVVTLKEEIKCKYCETKCLDLERSNCKNCGAPL